VGFELNLKTTNGKHRAAGKFGWYGYLGFAVILLAELGLILKWQFVEVNMTPLCWTGLILFLDAVNFKISGQSLIMTRRKEFLFMLPLSIAFWYLFEFYNLFIRNWHYVGLPENPYYRYFGYFWSFATIWPGVLEIYELIKNLNILSDVRVKKIKLSGALLTSSFVFGLICMVVPFPVSSKTATYLAAPVWVGIVFLLDPLNYSWKRKSIWGDWSQGQMSRLFQLFLAGSIAGFLWEFWNFWSATKWIYTVPIVSDIKVFEMPVVGFLGFLPFAVEIFVMWETAKFILRLPD
jgi:hypothetical protein